MPLFADPPSQYHCVDHYTGRIVQHVRPYAKLKKHIKCLTNPNTQCQVSKPISCPKWVKGILNFFTKHHVK